MFNIVAKMVKAAFATPNMPNCNSVVNAAFSFFFAHATHLSHCF